MGFVGYAGNGEGVLVAIRGKQIICDKRGRIWNSKETRGGEPEFFESDGDLYAIGSLGCVEINTRCFLG